MFGVDIMALVSYDQIHFTDSNAMAMLYWTIVGAYLVHGDEYDIKTLLDISVFDVASRKLLFRAPGVSQSMAVLRWRTTASDRVRRKSRGLRQGHRRSDSKAHSGN